MLKLLNNWRDVARKAWSFRLSILAAILSGIEFILPYFSDAMPRGVFAALAFSVTVAAAVARLVAQPEAKL